MNDDKMMDDDESDVVGYTADSADHEESSSEAVAASVMAKVRARAQLSADIEAFLKAGGRVTQVDDNVRSDPPKKPDLNYGTSPI
ncbi:hypothetical protein [Allohahella sp. A8]|uniref:hypothetical protein n=1 Tax=Allohahella sp. A8 TaxID=3141461 RepID=UPI000C09A5F3|nr:hypothetical protein [Hahellaceae bacterium]|tara:strand:- start:49818 stop:50072 length:255 start_codon:yes stop_codon:yes gene_type:complete